MTARETTAPPSAAVDVPLPPDPLGYRLKRWLLGPPLGEEAAAEERLGKVTALAVFSSDAISSTAYGTEEILRVLVPAVGVAAFSLVVPLALAVLLILIFLVLSYRQTIPAYPTAGGAYMVTRDNFGLLPAQVAGVALLVDYVLTVAVSVSAGTAAITSLSRGLLPWAVPVALSLVGIIAYGNLRGVRASGRIFSVPTYAFIASAGLLVAVGVARLVAGTLPVETLRRPGLVPAGRPGSGLLLGASAFIVARAFASGSAALTGVEAISNGVSAFRPPEADNAKATLATMGVLLGTLFLGFSVLAARTHATPFVEGSPTVIAEIGRLVFGPSTPGRALYGALQVSTTLILVMAANTSFADFPRLASFHARDNFLPRQLTKRGHRLVFSNGILTLAVAASVAVIATGAKVDRLIPLYAVGVFTAFTLSQAGMTRHHLRQREEGWRRGLWINGTGAVLSGVADVVIAVTKFTHGAWVVIVIVPPMVAALVRLNRQYDELEQLLTERLRGAARQTPPARHVVVVVVDRLDVSVAETLRYARSLHADDLRAVHLAADPRHGDRLRQRWAALGLPGLDLDVVACPDRRLDHCLVEFLARMLHDPDVEVSVVASHRTYRRFWQRLVDDPFAERVARVATELPRTTLIVVPYEVGRLPARRT